jgi:hypothetical protein
LIAANEYGFINVTKFDQVGPATASYASLSSTYARIAATFDLVGWDSAIGVQNWSGSSVFGTAAVNQTGTTTGADATWISQNTNASAVDMQMQGAVGGMPLGLYLTYVTAPASGEGAAATTSDSNYNALNAGSLTRSSINFAAELGIIPEKATVGFAVRQGNSGLDKGRVTNGNSTANATNENLTDNAIYLTASYKLAQNLLVRLSWVNQTGSYWDTAVSSNYTGYNGTKGSDKLPAQDIGSNSTTFNLYALF